MLGSSGESKRGVSCENPGNLHLHRPTLATHIDLIFATLPTWLSMKDWPPNPGLTDMTRIRSTVSSTYSSTSG